MIQSVRDCRIASNVVRNKRFSALLGLLQSAIICDRQTANLLAHSDVCSPMEPKHSDTALMHWPRSSTVAATLIVAALPLAGCGVTRSTDTTRTATEQLLVSDA